MRRGTKFILGLSVALLTAASLNYTVGNRFHAYGYRNFGHYGCGGYWGKQDRHHQKIPNRPAPVEIPQKPI